MEFIENNKLSSKKMAIWFSLAVFFVLIDRFLKILSLKQFNFTIINNLFEFNLAKNYFIAFSIPISGKILNYLILIIIFSLIYYYLRLKNYFKIPIIFIILGASSNLLDRFQYGYVIDYLSVKWFTVFNIADIMIVCAISFLLFIEFNKKA